MTEQEKGRNETILQIIGSMDVSAFPYDEDNDLQGLIDAAKAKLVEQDASLSELSEDEQDLLELNVIKKKRAQLGVQGN